jgi:hypothetical protein
MSLTAVLILIILAFVGAGAVAVLLRHRSRPAYLTAHDKAAIHVGWHKIEEHLTAGGPTRYRAAVIEADTLLDHCLKQLNVPGDSLGERLRQSRNRFQAYDDVWQAHRVRNQVVHETDKELLASEAKSVVAKFRQALTDLGAL